MRVTRQPCTCARLGRCVPCPLQVTAPIPLPAHHLMLVSCLVANQGCRRPNADLDGSCDTAGNTPTAKAADIQDAVALAQALKDSLP